jgi:outer membrane protein OmpA-like peptidoglycan-associated protein
MLGRVWIGILGPLAFLLAAGCASQDWVREFWGTKEGEINQRFDKVEARAGEEAQRVEGMGGRVQGLETSVKETGQVAKGAQGRAEAAFGRGDAAFAKAEEVDGRMTRLWSNRRSRTVVETLDIHFGFDRWQLSDEAQTGLQPIIKELRENSKLTVDLQGYADSLGGREYNVRLSERRVEAVRRYLVEQGVELARILSIGMGPLPGGKREERLKNRRVTLKVMLDAD